MPTEARHPLLYVLHSSHLYGTERIALETLNGLKDEFLPVLFGPPGPAMEEAEKLGFQVQRFKGMKDFARVLRPALREHPRLTFVATSVTQATVCILLNTLYRRQIKHFQIVHGGAEGSGAFGRKKWLRFANIRFITVSDWAKEQLIANGVPADRIEVVANSLSPARIASAPRRGPYEIPGLHRVLIVERLDPSKRVDLLIDALDHERAELADVSFRILGLGMNMKELVERAAKSHPNVEFAGFSNKVPLEMAAADLLIHTCSTETFGLVVLEAMAANLVVLVPDLGGAGSLVKEDTNGFKFCSDDPTHLAECLVKLKSAPPELLNRIVAGGRVTVEQTYAASLMVEKYRRLFRME